MYSKKWPEKGEFVVGTVTKVMDFGAFVALDEYEGKEGLIHISEVASGWIKYIRDHVREGQKVVCKVLNVDKKRGHIDLSLKDVNEHQRREKIQQWKNEQKADKWLRMVAEKLGLGEKEIREIGAKLEREFGGIYYAFEEAATNISALLEAGIEKEIAEKIQEIAKQNIKVHEVMIDGFVDVTSPNPNGVEEVREALKSAYSFSGNGVSVEVSYVGAPRYRIRVRAPDYKIAEDVLRKASEAVIKKIKEFGGTGVFHRHVEGQN
ncbi:MAG: translation initiation factor 2 subunit 1 [Archaeoglobi archaeon]|nr:translation initiation factor IF-2 subunit alpha [Candidatus Mnemosynella bozhongmuii]MDK2781862.1 translation initiation factor 2 subunit 1 [Archaeoglobi archaeon]